MRFREHRRRALGRRVGRQPIRDRRRAGQSRRCRRPVGSGEGIRISPRPARNRAVSGKATNTRRWKGRPTSCGAGCCLARVRSLHAAAVRRACRGESANRRQVVGSAPRYSAIAARRSCAADEPRHAEPRRSDHHRQPSRVLSPRRSTARSAPSDLDSGKRAMESAASRRRTRNADDLRSERASVRGDRGGGGKQSGSATRSLRSRSRQNGTSNRSKIRRSRRQFPVDVRGRAGVAAVASRRCRYA